VVGAEGIEPPTYAL